jgi:hypothetical protein
LLTAWDDVVTDDGHQEIEEEQDSSEEENDTEAKDSMWRFSLS